MEAKLRLSDVLFVAFFLDVALLCVNGALWKSGVAAQMICASLGIFLLIVPVYPVTWERLYGAEKARTLIRLAALVQIASCFMIRVAF